MFILVMVRHSNQFGSIWFTLVSFSLFWSILVHFGLLLVYFCSIWFNLVHSIYFSSFGPFRSNSV